MCPSAAAYIKAVCCFDASRAFTSARWSSSTRRACVLPVRDTSMSGVSPGSDKAALESTPESRSFPIMTAFPLMQARYKGVTPSRFRAWTSAPARMSRSAISKSSQRTAQWSAVAPSACGALTSAFCSRSERTAAAFFFIAASASALDAACTLPAAISVTAHNITAHASERRLDLCILLPVTLPVLIRQGNSFKIGFVSSIHPSYIGFIMSRPGPQKGNMR
jgi:hypothetical protein